MIIYDEKGKNVKNKNIRIFIRNVWGDIAESEEGLKPSTKITNNVVSQLNKDYSRSN